MEKTTWQEFVRTHVQLRDDPYTGVMPIVYAGPGLVTILALIMTASSDGPLHEAFKTDLLRAYVIVGFVALLSVLTMIISTKISQRNSLARARHIVTNNVAWLASILGDEKTLEILQRYEQHDPYDPSVFGCVDAWRRLSHLMSDNDLVETLRGAVEHGKFTFVHTVLSECFPRTAHGWSTNFDKLDVLPRALHAVVLQGDFSATAFRANVRHALYSV